MEQAFALDTKKCNAWWADAISKDLENVKVVFEISPDEKKLSIGHQYVQCNIVFNTKEEDFRWKTQLVAKGNMTKAPANIMNTTVVSRETLKIALIIATLYNCEFKCGDILNTYIQAPVTEKAWTILDPEIGKDTSDCLSIIWPQLLGAAVRSHHTRCMEFIRYKCCKAGLDLSLKPETRPEDGIQYYFYLLCYVDDIIWSTIIQMGCFCSYISILKPRYGNPEMS